MFKSSKYTLITLFLAVAFILGSMDGMDFILRVREKQLLGASGTAAIVSPVRAWQQGEGDIEGEADQQADDDGYVLDIGQIEEVIRSRNHYDEEVIHDPVRGQISIEKAIEAGEKWIAEMGIDVGNEMETGEGLDFVNAILVIRKQKGALSVQMEPYYSFWTVGFSDQSTSIVLCINAVTGKVWNAEILLKDHMLDEPPYKKLRRFSELAGFQASDKRFVKVSEGKEQAILEIENSSLYTRMRCAEVIVDSSSIVSYSDAGSYPYEYVRITYDLLLKENE